MRKKLVCIFLTAILILSIFIGNASGRAVDASEEVTASDISFSQKKVGICIYSGKDDFMYVFEQELVAYLLKKGFTEENVVVMRSSNDQDIQYVQIKNMIDNDVDALIVNPVNSSVVHRITDLATAAGIPLVYINREPSGEEEERWEEYNLDVTYVGCDARQSGIFQGELVLEIKQKKLDVNGDGVIQYFMLEGAHENIDAEYRTAYSLATLESAGLQLECLMDEVGNWNYDIAKDLTTKALLEGKIPELIISNNDVMALGAIEALQNAGFKPGQNVFVVGVDGLSDALKAVSEGTMVGTVLNDYAKQSHNAADAVMNYLDGTGNEHYISCDYKKVDFTNAEFLYKKVEGN